MQKRKLDISLIIGVFSSSIVLWFFLYSTIIDLTTEEPAALSLIYLGFAHYLSFLCVLYSFILMLDNGLEIGLEELEYNKLKKFKSIANHSRRVLFSLWGLMFIFSITSLLSKNIFVNSKYRFLEENVGFILGIVLCILFFATVGINVFRLIIKMNIWLLVATPILVIIYTTFLSLSSADIKYKVEKDFYENTDTVHFEIKRKGYIFLPQIKYVLYNFGDTLKEYTDGTYYIELGKYIDTRQSLVEITYSPQAFGNDFRKYIYINKTPK